MRNVGYLLLLTSFVEIAIGQYGLLLNLTVFLGIVLSAVGTWLKHRKK